MSEFTDEQKLAAWDQWFRCCAWERCSSGNQDILKEAGLAALRKLNRGGYIQLHKHKARYLMNDDEIAKQAKVETAGKRAGKAVVVKVSLNELGKYSDNPFLLMELGGMLCHDASFTLPDHQQEEKSYKRYMRFCERNKPLARYQYYLGDPKASLIIEGLKKQYLSDESMSSRFSLDEPVLNPEARENAVLGKRLDHEGEKVAETLAEEITQHLLGMMDLELSASGEWLQKHEAEPLEIQKIMAAVLVACGVKMNSPEAFAILGVKKSQASEALKGFQSAWSACVERHQLPHRASSQEALKILRALPEKAPAGFLPRVEALRALSTSFLNNPA